MRRKIAFINLVTSIGFQIINLLSGILIPRYIIFHYGSDVNGLVNSITQFLTYICFTEAGISNVIMVAYYKAFAKNDIEEISVITKTSKRFFRIIGYIFILYVAFLALIYPHFVKNYFDTWFTISLLGIISFSTIARYLLGNIYRLLIQADQKIYFTNILESLIVIINAIVVVVLIKTHFSVHTVKLASVIIYSVPSVIYYFYVVKKYSLIKECPYNDNLIKDRWNAFGHQIASAIHFYTDSMVLTIFKGVEEVSVYSIYAMIISGIRTLLSNFSNALSATFGSMIANHEEENLKEKYIAFDYLNLLLTAIFYTVTAVLMVPFIKLYTFGVSDVNYIRPYFAIILIFAESFYNIQYSYNMIVFAAGHFKQTKRDSYIEALINMGISLILVQKFGLSGVAAGTFCAMLWRMITYAIYLTQNIIHWNLLSVFKRYFVTLIGALASYIVITPFMIKYISGYISWILCGFITFVITTSMVLLVSFILNPKEVKKIYQIYFQNIILRLSKQ